MKVQVLVAAMDQKDRYLPTKMNIQTDAVVGNQCDFNAIENFLYKDFIITYLNFSERGVGLNRNNALMRADGDILIFADEDEVFNDGYADIVAQAYKQLPDADAIVFNITTIGTNVGRREIKKIHRIHLWNALNYGAARLTVRRDAIERENVVFHRQFGGGTMYSSGEDTLFIADLIKRGLKVYVYPANIASVDQTSSTWFEGYTEKYFYDKGALFAALSKKLGWLLCRLILLKNKKELFKGEISYRQGKKLAKSGMEGFKNNLSYAQWKANEKGKDN